jgi:hypothetical protein
LKKYTIFIMLFMSNLLYSGGFVLRPSSGSPLSTGAHVPPPVIPPAQTTLKLSPVNPLSLGQNFAAIATLTDAKGTLLSNENIQFYLDGQYIGQAKTLFGVAWLQISKNFQAGNHKLMALFLGNKQLTTVTNTIPLIIYSNQFTIQTVPPIPGVQFKMGNQTFISGPDGVAHTTITNTGVYTLEVQQSGSASTTSRFEFNRWLDENYTPQRSVNFPQTQTMQVGFDIYNMVSQNFVDLNNKPVDPKRITAITIKNAQGDVLTFPNGQPRWLYAAGVARRSGGLEEDDLLYSILNVTIDGSNVVNQYQQRFYAHPGDNWQISLLLYKAQFSAHDALFRFPVGVGINMTYPNGRSVFVPFGSDGTASVSSLARGTYQVQVAGASGVVSLTPVALSQDQAVNLLIPSAVDILLVLLVGLVFAVGIVIIGRPWLLFGRRSKPVPATARVSASRHYTS